MFLNLKKTENTCILEHCLHMWNFLTVAFIGSVSENLIQCSKSMMTAAKLGVGVSDGVVHFVVTVAVNVLVFHAPVIWFWC